VGLGEGAVHSKQTKCDVNIFELNVQ